MYHHSLTKRYRKKIKLKPQFSQKNGIEEKSPSIFLKTCSFVLEKTNKKTIKKERNCDFEKMDKFTYLSKFANKSDARTHRKLKLSKPTVSKKLKMLNHSQTQSEIERKSAHPNRANSKKSNRSEKNRASSFISQKDTSLASHDSKNQLLVDTITSADLKISPVLQSEVIKKLRK